MVRSVALTAFGMLALTGCASIDYEPVATAPVTTTPITPAPSPAPSVDPAIYLSAPRAPLMSQLFACSANNSNIGPISADRASLVYTPYITTAAGALLRDPTEGACLSSGFGWRNRGENGSNHTGIDLANPNGGFVFAAADGTIAYTGWEGGYGIVVEIDHGRGVHTLYGHLADVNPNLRPGSFVRAGSAIARMGMTGNATGIHLHYEVSIDGLKVDPLNYGAANVVQVNQDHLNQDHLNQDHLNQDRLNRDRLNQDRLNRDRGQPIDAPAPLATAPAPAPLATAPAPAASVEIAHKSGDASAAPSVAPDASGIDTPAAPAPVSSAPPPQPPANEPLQVTPDSDGWTPGKSN